MAKATLTLQNGTIVSIEGTTEEVRALLASYGGEARRPSEKGVRRVPQKRRKATAATKTTAPDDSRAVSLSDIVNLVKTSEEAEAIEQQVLDRTSQVNRVLLPLFVVHELMKNAVSLSSGDISKITKDLGVPLSQPNVSTTLAGTASKYVIGDRVRRRGQGVKYKLSRRGVQYMRSVIDGASGEDEG